MSDAETTATGRKLSIVEQIVCALPIGLVAVGGAVGGAFGGLAWYFNQKIMRSPRSAPVRYALVALTFAGAIAAYFASVIVLTMLFPDVFGAG
jgi:hypothetical protein